MRVPGVPVLSQVLDESVLVEAEDEAVDVSVVLSAMSLRIHSMLPHNVVSIRKRYAIFVANCRDVVGVDAGVDL